MIHFITLYKEYWSAKYNPMIIQTLHFICQMEPNYPNGKYPEYYYQNLKQNPSEQMRKEDFKLIKTILKKYQSSMKC